MGNRPGGTLRGGAQSFSATGPSNKLTNSKGLGGNPSSLAAKKAPANKKPPKSNIFAAKK